MRIKHLLTLIILVSTFNLAIGQEENTIIFTDPIYTSQICKGDSLILSFNYHPYISFTNNDCACEISHTVSPTISGSNITRTWITKLIPYPGLGAGSDCRVNDATLYTHHATIKPTETSTYT